MSEWNPNMDEAPRDGRPHKILSIAELMGCDGRRALSRGDGGQEKGRPSKGKE